MTQFRIRQGHPADQAAAYYVCLKTGNHGADGESLYRDDPDALGRIFVGPYLALEPDLSLILEDDQGVCGYAFGAYDSRQFYDRYEHHWRHALCQKYPFPDGEPANWTRTQTVHSWYHQPNYFCPEPYSHYPSHMHIDLLERARGVGNGCKMMETLMDQLRHRGSPGVHLGLSLRNTIAKKFYERLGFKELARTGDPVEGSMYMGMKFS